MFLYKNVNVILGCSFMTMFIAACSGHGHWDGHECHCERGWTGNVCDSKFQVNIKMKYIENTRLVLNIAQVYPARLRKSKNTRLAE